MNTERDHFLTEVVLEECWHEGTGGGYSPSHYVCIKCNEIIATNKLPYPFNPDFSSPDGFFKLWNACKEKEWWVKFIKDYTTFADFKIARTLELIHPDRFADVVCWFLEEKK